MVTCIITIPTTPATWYRFRISRGRDWQDERFRRLRAFKSYALSVKSVGRTAFEFLPYVWYQPGLLKTYACFMYRWRLLCAGTRENPLVSFFPVSHYLPGDMILDIHVDVARTSPCFSLPSDVPDSFWVIQRYNHTLISLRDICSSGMYRRTAKRAPPWQYSPNGIKRILNYNRSI